MKKIFLLTILLFQLTFVFGQQDCVEELKTGVKRCWGAWRDFNGVQVSIRGPYNEGFNMINDDKNKNSYRWSFRFKPTNPSKAYSFLITATDNTGKSDYFGGVTYPCNSQKPGESTTYFRTFSNAETINVNISEIVELTAEVGNSNLTGTVSFDCNGKGWYDANSNSKNKTSSQQTQPQNDLTEYNRSKADLERQMQQQNQEIANRNAENQRQQQLLKQQQEQQRQQQLQQGINQMTNATVDLVTYFANRKNALRNSLSQEDGQALMDIVNSDNPVDYTQNIIQIFTDLGYTYRETKTDNDMTFITLGNDVANINDFMLISIQPASYDIYNRISFNYRNKLSQQLSALGNNLINKGGGRFEIKGISPIRQAKVVQKENEKNNRLLQEINTLKNTDKPNAFLLALKYYEMKDYVNAVIYYIQDYENNQYKSYEYPKRIADIYYDEDKINYPSQSADWYEITINLMENDDKIKADIGNPKSTFDDIYTDVLFHYAYAIAETNGNKAIEAYKKAVRQGYTGAYTAIGIIYKNGKGGVEKNWEQARIYFEKDAEKSAKAMYNLGKIYETGGYGLEQNKSKSSSWYKKACKKDKEYCK